jgi:hypothetical protein
MTKGESSATQSTRLECGSRDAYDGPVVELSI